MSQLGAALNRCYIYIIDIIKAIVITRAHNYALLDIIIVMIILITIPPVSILCVNKIWNLIIIMFVVLGSSPNQLCLCILTHYYARVLLFYGELIIHNSYCECCVLIGTIIITCS